MPPDSVSLLTWYDRHARVLPWRVGPKERAKGVEPDPYRVWLSEVMLQQTTVAAVKAYFQDFTMRWPTVEDLARAPRDDVMKAWAGLGYYARARNLKACAERVANDLGGRFPTTAAGLKELPGIGDYTAAAIAAIAYDEPVPVVDSNVERVVARLFAIDSPLPATKPIIREYQAKLTPKERAGDFAQAMMDLGATICTPKRPACVLCPWSSACVARAGGNPEPYPVKADKTHRPVRFGAAFVAIREDGAILLRQRPDKGLLGGMTEVPGSDWTADFVPAKARDAAPLAAGWRLLPGRVVHVFTHFRLELSVFRAEIPSAQDAPAGTWWSPAAAVAGEALPTVFRKVVETAVPGATKRPKRRAA
jgi:A/G-specific adenine glycosylase